MYLETSRNGVCRKAQNQVLVVESISVYPSNWAVLKTTPIVDSGCLPLVEDLGKLQSLI